MIQSVHDLQAQIQAFVSLGLWRGRGAVHGAALGWADDAGLVAGVVYHNWDDASGVIELTAYSTRCDWLNKDRLRAVFFISVRSAWLPHGGGADRS